MLNTVRIRTFIESWIGLVLLYAGLCSIVPFAAGARDRMLHLGYPAMMGKTLC